MNRFRVEYATGQSSASRPTRRSIVSVYLVSSPSSVPIGYNYLLWTRAYYCLKNLPLVRYLQQSSNEEVSRACLLHYCQYGLFNLYPIKS
jgi:hypothetical protein